MIQSILKIIFILCISLGVYFIPHHMAHADPASLVTTTTPEPPQTHTTLHRYGELWTGKLYSSTYRAGSCRAADGKMQGVLLLKLENGQIDVYHFYGNIDPLGVIRLHHHSGNRFEGNFVNEEEVKGKVTLANGFSMSLSGKRHQNVELTETCRPLPE